MRSLSRPRSLVCSRRSLSSFFSFLCACTRRRRASPCAPLTAACRVRRVPQSFLDGCAHGRFIVRPSSMAGCLALSHKLPTLDIGHALIQSGACVRVCRAPLAAPSLRLSLRGCTFRVAAHWRAFALLPLGSNKTRPPPKRYSKKQSQKEKKKSGTTQRNAPHTCAVADTQVPVAGPSLAATNRSRPSKVCCARARSRFQSRASMERRVK